MALLVEPPGEVQLEELAGGHRCCTFCCTGRKVPQPSRGKPSLTRGGAKGTRTPNMPVAAPARPRLDVAIHSCDELAAVSLSGKSAYCSTSSAMRSESAGLRSTGTNSPAADSRKNAASARAASSGLKHVADLCRHSGRHEQFLGLQSRATRCTRWCGSLSAPAGTRGPESTKITAEHSPKISSVRFAKSVRYSWSCQRGPSQAALGFLLRYLSCAFRWFLGFALRQRLS
jgi:hypothetical protein